jgi:hypothetical protein
MGVYYPPRIGPHGVSFYLWDMALKDGDPRIVGARSYLTPLLLYSGWFSLEGILSQLFLLLLCSC